MNSYCKDFLQITWELPYFMLSSANLRCCVPLFSFLEASVVVAGTLEYLNFLSVFLCEMKVTMLLKVRVQPVCTFGERFVLFRRFWFHVSLFGFTLLGKVSKVLCFEDFIFTSFYITKGKHQSTFIHQHPQVHYQFWNLSSCRLQIFTM